jgi:hypothetical protein
MVSCDIYSSGSCGNFLQFDQQVVNSDLDSTLDAFIGETADVRSGNDAIAAYQRVILGGASLNTSSAAPATCPVCRAAASAALSIRSARAVLTRRTPFFSAN